MKSVTLKVSIYASKAEMDGGVPKATALVSTREQLDIVMNPGGDIWRILCGSGSVFYDVRYENGTPIDKAEGRAYDILDRVMISNILDELVDATRPFSAELLAVRLGISMRYLIDYLEKLHAQGKLLYSESLVSLRTAASEDTEEKVA